MSSNWKRVRRDSPLPCDAVGEDDGIDPKLLFRPSSRRRSDRGVRRLCSQVREALTFAFAGSCRDETLLSLYVEDVEPAPDATRLAVTVRVPDDVDVAAARDRVNRAAALLREEVAASICRRRAPELVFRVLPSAEDVR
jgi:ribosome-binding factor A